MTPKFASILVLITSAPLFATVVELGTIEQPINLGARADPSRIPLGPVVFEANHGYGRHPLISAARPCVLGALQLKRGMELNMNLASAFGIEVIPEDSTNVPQAPVTIRIKDWPVPAYSPYRKDQVLSATLHCLLRSVDAGPKRPLKVLIEAENVEDADHLKGFAGEYLTTTAPEHGGPTPVPGCELTTDWRGVTYVSFSDATAPSPEALRRSPPVLIPFRYEQDDPLSYQFIPVWAGDDIATPGTILTRPVSLFHDLFDPSRSSGPDINDLTARERWHTAEFSQALDGARFSVGVYFNSENAPKDLVSSLCVAMHAAVLTAQPTAQRPLILQIRTGEHLLDTLKPFSQSGWTVGDPGSHGARSLTCRVIWDPNTRTITEGSIPLGTLDREAHGPWSLRFANEALAAATPSRSETDSLPQEQE